MKSILLAVGMLGAFAPSLSHASDQSILRVKIVNSGVRINAQSIPKTLDCSKFPNSTPNILAALDLAMKSHGISVDSTGEKWQKEAFVVFGYTTTIPTDIDAARMARRTLELARRDNLVAAKMSNDAAAMGNTAYKADRFFWDMDRYIRNNSIPNSPENGEALNLHESWLTSAANGVVKAKRILGEFYENRSVRFYLLGRSYDDGIAVDASSRLLCDTKFDKTVAEAASKVGSAIATRKPE